MVRVPPAPALSRGRGRPGSRVGSPTKWGFKGPLEEGVVSEPEFWRCRGRALP